MNIQLINSFSNRAINDIRGRNVKYIVFKRSLGNMC